MLELIKHGTKIDFLAKAKTLILISVASIVVIYALVPFRLNLGVDFAGGTEIEVKFNSPTTAEDVRKGIESAGFPGANVQTYGAKEENSFLVRVERVNVLSPEQAAKLRASLEQGLAAYGVQSIDFDPNVGSKVDIATEKPVPPEQLRAAVASAGVALAPTGDAIRDLTRAGQPSYQLITQGLSEKVTQALIQAFGQGKVEVRRVDYVGPQVGAQLRNRGIMSVLLAMGAILLYVAFRFQPKFAPGAIIALFHDVSWVLGYYVVTGHEFNLTSIAVMLTIVGYSINDTIVVYDRVREVEARKTGKNLHEIINLATNETLSRTIITSGVTALSLVGLVIFGVGSIEDFGGAMLVGIITGTFSSIYIASPFAIWIENELKKRELTGSSKKNTPGKPKRRATASAD